jgi:hypothetical protein
MVGGKVIGIVRKRGEPTTVNVEDTHHPGDTCGIEVWERRADNGTPVVIEIGDSIWWQGREAMWTPHVRTNRPPDKCGKTWDIHLPRVGYSFAS